METSRPIPITSGCFLSGFASASSKSWRRPRSCLALDRLWVEYERAWLESRHHQYDINKWWVKQLTTALEWATKHFRLMASQKTQCLMQDQAWTKQEKQALIPSHSNMSQSSRSSVMHLCQYPLSGHVRMMILQVCPLTHWPLCIQHGSCCR